MDRGSTRCVRRYVVECTAVLSSRQTARWPWRRGGTPCWKRRRQRGEAPACLWPTPPSSR